MRYSILNRLSYHQPVSHNILAIMHNWLEGILQHHFRLKWAFLTPQQQQQQQKQAARHRQDADGDPTFDQDDELQFEEDELAMELDDLTADQIENLHIPAARVRTRQQRSTAAPRSQPTSSDDDFAPDLESDSETETDSEALDSHVESEVLCIFSRAEISFIRACIKQCVLPTWVDRPPHNLGEAPHGKLKADTMFVLFTIVFPLCLPALWCKSEGLKAD